LPPSPPKVIVTGTSVSSEGWVFTVWYVDRILIRFSASRNNICFERNERCRSRVSKWFLWQERMFREWGLSRPDPPIPLKCQFTVWYVDRILIRFSASRNNICFERNERCRSRVSKWFLWQERMFREWGLSRPDPPIPLKCQFTVWYVDRILIRFSASRNNICFERNERCRSRVSKWFLWQERMFRELGLSRPDPPIPLKCQFTVWYVDRILIRFSASRNNICLERKERCHTDSQWLPHDSCDRKECFES